jgi:hypothetical protein
MPCFFFPEQCRQAKISYTGRFTATLCLQYNDGANLGATIRETINFGNFPIMLQVCYFVILNLVLKFLAYENALISIVKLDDTSSEH